MRGRAAPASAGSAVPADPGSQRDASATMAAACDAEPDSGVRSAGAAAAASGEPDRPRAGIVTRNVEPCPGALSTWTSP